MGRRFKIDSEQVYKPTARSLVIVAERKEHTAVIPLHLARRYLLSVQKRADLPVKTNPVMIYG
jgi:hypothetical protein